MSKTKPKVACPDCGLFRVRSSLKNHRGTRPCRARQIQDLILERHGLVMIHVLSWQKVLKWAGVSFSRWPAYAGTKYRRRHLRTHSSFLPGLLPDPEIDKQLYGGLGDALFVEPWVAQMLRHRNSPPVHMKKQHFATLVRALRVLNTRDDEFKKALMTTWALGGDRAINTLLVTEGIWTSQT